MENKIGFTGSCIADLNKAPEYINGIKHCYYDCSLKFGAEQKAEKWQASNNQILLQDFKDIGEKGWRNAHDFGTQVCIGQDVEMDTKFDPPLPEAIAKPFSVDSESLKTNPETPVSRVIYNYLNQIK